MVMATRIEIEKYPSLPAVIRQMSLESDLHPTPDVRSFLAPTDDDDGDTASQRSISLSSPAVSPRNSVQNPSNHFDHRASHPYTLDTDMSSEPDDSSMYTHEMGAPESPNTSAAPSVFEEPKETSLPTYPPSRGDTESIASVASNSSRKARPESMIVLAGDRPLVLGIALVDFNHLVGVSTLPLFTSLNCSRSAHGSNTRGEISLTTKRSLNCCHFWPSLTEPIS